MENLKIRTYGINELSERVQKELFRLGYLWFGETIQNINARQSSFLFADTYKRITHDYRNLEYFNSHENKEVTLQDLIDMPTPVKEE